MPDKPEIQLVTTDLIEQVRRKAESSPRLRMNHNFHPSDQSNPHRFLNVMLRGTYIRPHRHRQPPKAESWILLEGEALFFTFDDGGAVTGKWTISATGPCRGLDLAPGAWHSLAAVTECAVMYEVKPGPYEPATDKEFAPWAPAEGSPEAPAWLERLLETA